MAPRHRAGRHRLATARTTLGRRLPWLRALKQKATGAVHEARDQIAGRAGRTVGSDAGQQVDHLGFVFIVTYGRSGSTLLQGILNSTDGYLIRGENNAALHHLFRYHSTLEEERSRIRQIRVTETDSRSPHFGIDRYPTDRAIAAMRDLVVDTLLRPEPATRVTGFKEVRWFQDDWEGYLDFLQAVFPNARFIINTRKLEDVARSRWWPNLDDPLAVLKDHAARLDEIRLRLGDAAYPVHYDDYVADPQLLQGLFEWLGEPYDRARIDDVLGRRHSY